MAVFDITPAHRIVPSIGEWSHSSIVLPVVDQDHNHVVSLRDLEREFHIRVRLDSIDIHKNMWTSELMQTVYNQSYPLRGLMNMKTTVKITREWLGFWEIYSQTIIPGLTSRMEKRINAARERAIARAKDRKEELKEKGVSLRGVPVRSFHICDNHASSVQTMQRAINKVEFETGAQINWDWIATYTSKANDNDRAEYSKNKEKWTLGVDGEGAVNTANMRAWRNKIATQLKVADIVVGNNSDEEEKPSGIAFALMNLTAGGYAILRIPRISSTSMVVMIHLFAQCFESTRIIHTLSDDRMFLCGEGFLDNLTSKHHKLLYEFCEAYPGSTSMSPFNMEYMRGEHFTETLDKLMEINRAVQGWRYEYYEKLLTTYSRLNKSSASKTFSSYVEQVLDDTYKDESRKWIAATGFNFFYREE